MFIPGQVGLAEPCAPAVRLGIGIATDSVIGFVARVTVENGSLFRAPTCGFVVLAAVRQIHLSVRGRITQQRLRFPEGVAIKSLTKPGANRCDQFTSLDTLALGYP
jgi:hypothetical protein